ncbi:MAG: ABC transporter permease [Candidatus Paceibacteria bacterium]
MLIKFSKKIFLKEWRKLLLPFLSVVLTALVISVSYFLVGSARDFLEAKNKEFLGGDVVFEFNQDFSIENFIDPSNIKAQSASIELNALLTNGEVDGKGATTANIKFVDEFFPLYGEYVLQNAPYQPLQKNEVYLDQNIANTLGVQALGTVYFNKIPFTVKDIILEDPSSLFAGFNFFGTAIFAREAISYAGVDLALFRKEHEIKVALFEKLSQSEMEAVELKARTLNMHAHFDAGGGGFAFGISLVEKFLVVAILIISVLSLVNIYASVNYLSRRLRRDFAILLALGMERINIYRILLLVNLLVITLGAFLGIVLGYLSTGLIEGYIAQNFDIALVHDPKTIDLVTLLFAIIFTGLAAAWPIIQRQKGVSPRELLTKEAGDVHKKGNRKNILFDLVGIIPVGIFAVYFLGDFWAGVSVVAIIVLLYLVVMFGYRALVNLLYAKRARFSFSARLVITQKKFDGFFGLVSFASLFVALVSIFSLSIVRTSIEKFLLGDLQSTLPDSYVIDIQNSQKDALAASFPELNLFPNVRARIVDIDGVRIQEELTKDDTEIDRELGREFNLTYRNYLLPSEKVSSGVFDMTERGSVSVEKDFAERAGIKMNSQVVFLIQGFEVATRVTSIRESDTRSGLPFFYFILSPSDLAAFPATYFGYGNLDEPQQAALSVYLTEYIPNASIINTSSITALAEKIISFLVVIILMITLPPLLLSAFLIITLLATVAKERKRDGARLMALGRTRNFIRNYYILESIATTLFAAVLAYVVSILVTNLLILKYLDIDSLVYVEPVSLYVFSFTLVLLLSVSLLMWRSGGRSLREYLNYEENN